MSWAGFFQVDCYIKYLLHIFHLSYIYIPFNSACIFPCTVLPDSSMLYLMFVITNNVHQGIKIHAILVYLQQLILQWPRGTCCMPIEQCMGMHALKDIFITFLLRDVCMGGRECHLVGLNTYFAILKLLKLKVCVHDFTNLLTDLQKNRQEGSIHLQI